MPQKRPGRLNRRCPLAEGLKIARAGHWVYAALILGGIATALTWGILAKERQTQLEKTFVSDAEYAAHIIQRDLNQRAASTHRMARRWEAAGFIPEDLFTADAENHIQDMPGFRALSYANADYVADYVVPSAGSRARGRNIAAFSENRRQAIEQARATGQPTMTTPIELVDGSGLGFILFVPITIDGRYAGSLNAVFHVGSWIDALFIEPALRNTARNYAYQINLGSQVIAQSKNWSSVKAPTFSSSSTRLFGRDLMILLKPTEAYFAMSQSMRPEQVAGFMAALTALLTALAVVAKTAQQAQAAAHKANDGLRLANASLANEVTIRREAEVEALEASAAKSRFLATMSHEVRTPINAIMGMFELIQSADVPMRQRRQAKVGHAAAERLLDLLSNVLEVSRLQAKAVEFVPRRIRLTDLLDQWALGLEAMVRKSGKDLSHSVKAADDLPAMVTLDDRRLHQIVTNVLDNAVKCTDRGHIHLEMFPGSAPQDSVILDISDTGPGIPDAHRDVIFERFTQVDERIVRTNGGSGLGLAIARELAQAMGMTLTLHTTSDSGSVFRLQMPSKILTGGSNENDQDIGDCADIGGRGRSLDTVHDVRDARITGT